MPNEQELAGMMEQMMAEMMQGLGGDAGAAAEGIDEARQKEYFLWVDIYIYRERERMCMFVYTHIYIYIFLA